MYFEHDSHKLFYSSRTLIIKCLFKTGKVMLVTYVLSCYEYAVAVSPLISVNKSQFILYRN